MSIKLKDVRVRVARHYPSYFEACFAKCYDLRAVDTVADVASVALAHIREQEQVVKSRDAEISSLRSRITELEKSAPAAVEVPTTRFFVRLDDIPGARPANDGAMPPNVSIIGMIKAIRAATNMGLKEAKDIVDAYAREGRGQTIGPLSPEKAAELQRELAGMGGKVYIQPGSRA